MNPQYIAKEHEDSLYKMWEDSGAFKPNSHVSKVKGQSFSIIMPPPNVTGTLHIGHAVMLALQDIMVRYHRMKGEPTVWIPGTDHAAIATQTVVEKKLKKEQNETRHRLGREKFLEEVQKFVDASKERIHLQIRKMGASCDWSREAYTLDEPRTLAVRTAFKMLYDKGLIYRGDRIVNWCPRCASTLADDEVEHVTEKGALYYIRYWLKESEIAASLRQPAEAPRNDNPSSSRAKRGDRVFREITVATTRPETKLGDTAVAVHPDDPRYKDLIGKEFNVDLAGWNIHIKIVADKVIDPAFGSGAVGVTPAHSMTDAEIAERHGLPSKQVIDDRGNMVDAGKYTGMKVKEARAAFVEDLKTAGLLEKEEPISHNISICYRCSTPIEPLPKLQWFIAVNKEFKFVQSEHAPIKGLKDGQNVTLKSLMRHAVESNQIEIIPEHSNKNYFHWIDNLRDWCISRQIWFGHRIPVWYRPTVPPLRVRGGEEGLRAAHNPPQPSLILREGDATEIHVGTEPPTGDGWEQDPDTLDTWFSSGLWTFSTLGWPEKTKDFEMFHPTAVLETGYDILFFWIARMILMSTALIGEIPFRTVYLHGLVRDMQGRKMSKSIGNVIDPLDMTEKYGADAVRISLFMGTSAGTDVKLNEQKIAGYRNFANKIWNASRFVMMSLDEGLTMENVARDFMSRSSGTQGAALREADQAILAELSQVVKDVTTYLDKLDFNHAGDTAYHYFWHTFCDKIIEAQKPRLRSEDAGEKATAQYLLYTILTTSLKLLHPFMPFVTEAVWQQMPQKNKSMLITEQWPS